MALRKVSFTPEEKLSRRRRALMRFKGLVHSVIANLYWLTDMEDFRLGDDVTKNIGLLKRKKIKKSTLTVREKSILSKPKEERTDKEKQLLSKVIGGLKCFRRYPPNVKKELAAVTYFVYYGPGREIVKQDHEPLAMYFVLSGEASVTVSRWDDLLQEWADDDSGSISAGTMFGEVALIHGIERLATIKTETPCELLMIKKDDFDKVLKATVLKAWDEIQKIMTEFAYFKNWDAVTKRECSIISRTKVFAPEETVLGDNSAMHPYVFFLTKGTCSLIEYLPLKVQLLANGKKKYELYHHPTDHQHPHYPAEEDMDYQAIIQKYMDETNESSSESNFSGCINLALSRPSPSDHAKSIKTMSSSLNYKHETHFIKICNFMEGACFNIGENLHRRRVIASTPVSVLLVPRHFIWKNNKDNVWSRVKQFLSIHIPSSQNLLKKFVQQKEFSKYSKSLMKDIWAQKRTPTGNSIHNVPYSIRLALYNDDEDEYE